MIYRLLLLFLFSAAIHAGGSKAYAQESAETESAAMNTATDTATDIEAIDSEAGVTNSKAEVAEEEETESAASKDEADEADEKSDSDDDGEDHADDDHAKGHEDDDHAHDDDDHAEHSGHGAHGGGGSESAPNPLATDPDLALWTLGIFLLMLFVLKSIAWTPIIEGLKAREEGITSNIAAADAKHEEAKALLSEHQAKLAGTADEVRELLEEARRDAEQTKADILAEAKSAADKERERAVRDIEQARDSAVRQLAESSAGMAIDLAGKVVRQDISSERQGEIVKEALGRFVSGDPSSN